MKKLGEFLSKRGYTVHAPIYSGHGVEPEALLETRPEDWWNDVVEGYNFLKVKAMRKLL